MASFLSKAKLIIGTEQMICLIIMWEPRRLAMVLVP